MDNARRKRDDDWDGNEPMTGTPMTGENKDSSYNYLTNGATRMTRENNVGYVPEMRDEADGNKILYDIEADLDKNIDDDLIVKNNIATQEFDYTKAQQINK